MEVPVKQENCIRLFFVMHRNRKSQGWWIWFLLAVLTIVLGILVMFGESVMPLLGISLIIDGVSDIVTTLWLSAGVRKVKKEIEKDDNNFGDMDEVK